MSRIMYVILTGMLDQQMAEWVWLSGCGWLGCVLLLWEVWNVAR